MTQDEIIEMAKQAGFHLNMWQLSLGCEASGTLDELVAFAKLVAQHECSWEKFCDSHCVWTDHHPDCKLAKDEPVSCRACTGSGRMVRDPDIGTDQECFACEGSGVFEDTTPPQRKPLTDEEINALDYSGTRIEFVRAIEAKLWSKNYD